MPAAAIIFAQGPHGLNVTYIVAPNVVISSEIFSMIQNRLGAF